MFFSKSIDEKIDSWGKKGYIGKLFKIARTHENQVVRARAYAAMGNIRDLSAVEALLDCFKLEEAVVVKLACAASLEKISTRKEFDKIQYLIDREDNQEVKDALCKASIAAKDRGERW